MRRGPLALAATLPGEGGLVASGLAREAELLEVVGGHVLALLLVEIDARVELLHDLRGHVLLDVGDDLLALGPELVGHARCGPRSVML